MVRDVMIDNVPILVKGSCMWQKLLKIIDLYLSGKCINLCGFNKNLTENLI
jgi:hypothetical protein